MTLPFPDKGDLFWEGDASVATARTEARSCSACGFRPTLHRQVHVVVGEEFDHMKVGALGNNWILNTCVDEGIAGLIAKCALHGIYTKGSCQGDRTEQAYVGFWELRDADLWARIMTRSNIDLRPALLPGYQSFVEFDPVQIKQVEAAFDSWDESVTRIRAEVVEAMFL